MSPAERQMRSGYYGDISRLGGIGNSLLDMFQQRAQGFDPAAAYQQQTQAAHGMLQDRFTQQLQQMRGMQVGSGRLNTGFAVGDEDRLFRQTAQDASRISAQNSLQAQGLNLSFLNQLGGLGSGLATNAMDARAGEYHTLRQQRLADKAQKRRGWGNLLGGVLSAAGTIGGAMIGGPMGASVGGKLGGSLGGLFGGD